MRLCVEDVNTGSIFDPDTRAALKMNVLSVTPYEACAVGNYRVTGYPANHGTDQGSLLYSIEQGHHAVFYGTDTSVLSEEVWEHLLLHRTRYDLLVLDHTYGIGLDSRPADHLGSRDVIAHADRFREGGLLKDNGIVYATHISHEGNLEHDELDEYAGKHGYRVAFERAEIDIGWLRKPWTTQITHDNTWCCASRPFRQLGLRQPLDKYGIRKPWNIKVNGTEAMTVQWRI